MFLCVCEKNPVTEQMVSNAFLNTSKVSAFGGGGIYEYYAWELDPNTPLPTPEERS